MLPCAPAASPLPNNQTPSPPPTCHLPATYHFLTAQPRACPACLPLAAFLTSPPPCRYTFRLDPGRRQVPLKVKQGITVAPAEGVWVLVRSR